MWIAFRTTVHGHTKPARDHYLTCPTEQVAHDVMRAWREDPHTYCAGVAKITAATEPQWLED